MQQTSGMNMKEGMVTHPYVSIRLHNTHWRGVEAVLAKLSVPTREFIESAPPQHWPENTVMLHVAGPPVLLLVEEERGWQKIISRPGDLMFAPKGATKRFQWAEASTNLALCISDRLITEVAADTVAGDPAQISLRPAGHFTDPLLAQMGYSIAALMQDSPADTRLYGESLVTALTHHLLYYHTKRKRAGAAPKILANPNLKRTLEYIHIHYDLSLSLEDLAAHANMSVAHFTRLFRQSTGRSPYQYVIALRCEEACKLLQSRQHTVTEVAQRVGFFDHSHFVRHFKRLYNVTPSEWLVRQG